MEGSSTHPAIAEIANAASLDALEAVRKAYLGKEGTLTVAIKGLKDLSEEKRRATGSGLTDAKRDIETALAEREEQLARAARDEALKAEAEPLGATLPKIGHLHPLTETVRQMNAYFERMGYSVVAGPELETDEFCFQRLNVPADHPAREMQDTVYIEQPHFLLRTQTSATEARILASQKPPFKVVIPGRVYRNEKPNRSNHFVFHHYQGVVVLRKTSLKDLFGTLRALFQEMYGPDVVIRFRNKYYPEVEPGVGPDMQCFNCHGSGCPVCKHVGWIEMGGAGMIHPFIMKEAGLDPEEWRGFAFGLGLDRWVMAKYGIDDIRTLLGGNLAYKHHEHARTL